jgi:hypothetical protein
VPFSIVKIPAGQALKLEGAVTIRHAQELYGTLGECLEEGAPVEVDTTGLEDIDTCILQLLCCLRKTVPALTFADPASAFLGAVDRCGLRRELLGVRDTP